MDKCFEIKLHKSFDGYLGKLIIDESYFKSYKLSKDLLKGNNFDTIVILDRSGSMGADVSRIVNKILPGVFNSLNYDKTLINLITFDSSVNQFFLDCNGLISAKIHSQGCTQMSPVVDLLLKSVNNSDKTNFRILTISDGLLDDQDQTLQKASSIAEQLKKTFRINSQAIRFFTSGNQPDTRGLSAFLQFNNTGHANLVDISSQLRDDEIQSMIASLFVNDNLSRSVKLISDNKVLKTSPWLEPESSTNLIEGENTVWFSDLPESLYIQISDNEKIQVKISSTIDIVNSDNFSSLMQDKVNYYMNQLKILKIINTTKSIEEVSNIVEYFRNFEKMLEVNESDNNKFLEKPSLKGRLEYYKAIVKKREKSIFGKMNEIANDDKVNKLNLAQQADYLRQIDTNKAAKNLAKRAISEGLDFDVIARKEVLEMRKNLNELQDIDDSNHTVSFYSACTTLDGIRTTCSLADNGLLESLDANDILKMLNIVGIACRSHISQYPDPMVWRILDLYQGCYVSLSDILVAYEVSNGKSLVDISTKKEIVNTIPFFDDQRINVFLKKYAPTLLEYTASIGMRRIIANIPNTYSNTLSNGVWKLVECLNTVKSDINIRTFINMTKAYELAIGSDFDYVLGYIKKQDPSLSFFISNNGITNMISSIIQLSKKNDTLFFPEILRALYAFETYQVIRKIIRLQEDPEKEAVSLLKNLLGIDFDKYSTKIPDNFVVDENPVFYDNYHINNDLLDEWIKKTWYLDYVCLLPDMIYGAYQNNSIDYIKGIPELSEEYIKNKLNISYDIKTFKLFNFIQALMYPTKAVRVDEDNKKMRISDLKDFNLANREIKAYIKTQYNNKYVADIAVKTKVERQILLEELLAKQTYCDNIADYISYFKTGITKGIHTMSISDSSKIGFVNLKDNLIDLNQNIPLRLEKLRIILVGTDEKDNIIWNSGNCLRLKLDPFEEVFKKLGKDDVWEEIKNIYKTKKSHIYREKANRQGHSNNKPSYWAFGYDDLFKMKKVISEDEYKDYAKIHFDCCGVNGPRKNFKKKK